MAIILPQRDISTGKAMYDVDSGLMIATGAEPAVYECGIFRPDQVPSGYYVWIEEVAGVPREGCSADAKWSGRYHKIEGVVDYLTRIREELVVPMTQSLSCTWALTVTTPSGLAQATHYHTYIIEHVGWSEYVVPPGCDDDWPDHATQREWLNEFGILVGIKSFYPPGTVQVLIAMTLKFAIPTGETHLTSPSVYSWSYEGPMISSPAGGVAKDYFDGTYLPTSGLFASQFYDPKYGRTWYSETQWPLGWKLILSAA